jgi:hypothetical protein
MQTQGYKETTCLPAIVPSVLATAFAPPILASMDFAHMEETRKEEIKQEWSGKLVGKKIVEEKGDASVGVGIWALLLSNGLDEQ